MPNRPADEQALPSRLPHFGPGALLAIGGAEDKLGKRSVLRAFV